MSNLKASQIIYTGPFDAQLTGEPKSYTKEWKNETDKTLHIWKAHLWFGMDIHGRGDIWGTLARISDGSPLLVTNWDRYAEPTGIHNLSSDYAPNTFDISPGDGLRLDYGCRAFLFSRILTMLWTFGRLPMRGDLSATIFYTED